MKQFYDDLGNWVESINQKSGEMSKDEYWGYIFESANKLSKKYNNHPLFFKVVQVHINYLADMIDDSYLPF